MFVIRIIIAGYKALPELTDNYVKEFLLERAATHLQLALARRVVVNTSTHFQHTEVDRNKSFWVMATATVEPLPG